MRGVAIRGLAIAMAIGAVGSARADSGKYDPVYRSKIDQDLNYCLVDVSGYVESTLGHFDREAYIRNIPLKCLHEMVVFQAMYGEKDTLQTMAGWGHYKETHPSH